MPNVPDALASPLMTSICMLRQFVRQKCEGDRSGKVDIPGHHCSKTFAWSCFFM